MKSVFVFRFSPTEEPGYLQTFLNERGIHWQLIKLDQGEQVPAFNQDVAAVALMGGPMSVNDDLPWIPPVLALIREAVAADVPVLGHCLGGQLISKALGAVVTQNPVKEIGWGEVTVSVNETADSWFGDMESFNGFHWHGETFSLPEGATHLLASKHCQNQAYAIGKHLAFQCHIEMTPEMVEAWCDVGADEIRQSSASPAVQSAEVIMENLPLHCFFLNKVANVVYAQWIKGLAN